MSSANNVESAVPTENDRNPSLTTIRPRRLRRTSALRRMVRENHLTVDDLIYPMFVMEGEGQKVEIASMPGCYRYSLDLLLKEIAECWELGINAIALFPVISENKKDDNGSESYNPEGLIQQTVKAIKQNIPEIVVITDVALDPSDMMDGRIGAIRKALDSVFCFFNLYLAKKQS